MSNKTSFGKIMFASALGFVIGEIILLILSLIFIIGGALSVLSLKEISKVKPNSVLLLEFNKMITETSYDNDFDLLSDYQSIALNDILKAIDEAKKNQNIKGILLKLDNFKLSYAEVNELYNALNNFKKETKKFIFAHANNYTQNAYLLATVADKIYLTPTGNFLWHGLASVSPYFKGLLEKLEIQPIVIRHGKFKSAAEPFILKEMSEENRLQINEYLSDVWRGILKIVNERRNISIEKLNYFADSLLVRNSQLALEYGFVDSLAFFTDVEKNIRNLLKISQDIEINYVTYKKVLHEKKDRSENKIAIVYAEGQIIEGKSSEDIMGSETISKAIEYAANDEDVKAIVLRVNSPGGSALASEIILKEVLNAKAKKPVVVSMGRLAASGGYYISCQADYIVAEPYTLTGSIGVFGLFFNVKDFANKKLGVTFNYVKTNRNADLANMTRDFSPEERKYLENMIEDIYQQFISHVASGRKLNPQYVDSVAQGRIWSAEDALSIGLIDEIGTIQTALNVAAKLAKISDYSVEEYPKYDIFDRFSFLKDFYEQTVLMKKLGPLYDTYKQYTKLNYLQGIQMLMPIDITVQ